ncbi:MAG: putative lipid II flippase FtsW [Alcanivoracaceae bacterium]|nr:putative lipid II flippase FtsW [Alcanivoracaceae bacterium]
MALEGLLHHRRPEDMWLLGGVMLLAITGLVMVMSASLQIAETKLGSPFYFFSRHLVYLLLAVTAGVLTYLLVPVAMLEKLRMLALIGAVLILLAVLIPGIGREVNGSQRWISLPGFNIQASEPAKLGYLIWLAGYINNQRDALQQRWQTFLMPLGVLGFLALLLLAEPDFGAAVVLGIATMGMLFMAGVPMLRFLSVALAVVLAAAAVALLQPYRVARLMSFLDPWADQFGGGYQLTQSLIAFGRGHIDGVGLGNSVQKLFYLPEAHTDFVFAVTAEEFGLIGTVLLISLFILVCARIFQLAFRLLDKQQMFSGQLVLGIALVFASQAFVNMGVNMGLLPTKGLTLPLVSYGGSSLLVMSVMIALVLKIGTEATANVPVRRRERR